MAKKVLVVGGSGFLGSHVADELTDKGYEALSVNYADLRKHILAQNEIIIQYKEYYEPAKEAE